MFFRVRTIKNPERQVRGVRYKSTFRILQRVFENLEHEEKDTAYENGGCYSYRPSLQLSVETSRLVLTKERFRAAGNCADVARVTLLENYDYYHSDAQKHHNYHKDYRKDGINCVSLNRRKHQIQHISLLT